MGARFSNTSETIGMCVPNFDVVEYFEKKSKYALCVPVINEGDRIKNQLQIMKELSEKVDVIIADGGSTDNSLETENLKRCGISSLLIKTGAGKLSAQMRMAMGYCLKRGYEGIIFVDGNGKDDPREFLEFIKKLEAGYDHIQGSRFIKGGFHENTPLIRYLGIRLLHAPLISLAAGFCYTDTTNGFRGYSRKFLLDDKVAPFREVFSTYELHYYLSIRAARLKFKCIEVPVRRVYPKGEVPTKIKSWKGYWFVFKILLNAIFGRYNPCVR